MNIRHTLLAALLKDSATIPDLEIATGMDRKKLHDNLKSCVETGLVTRSKDDVTGLPLYSISKAGKARLAEGPQRGKASPKQQRCDTPAGGGDVTPATVDRSTSQVVVTPDEATVVVEAAEQDDAPAEPASDVILSLCEQRDAMQKEINMMRGRYEYVWTSIRKAGLVTTPLPSGIIGYAVIPDDDELTIYATDQAARQKTEDLMTFEPDKYPAAFVVAIHARAEMKISWGDV